MGERRLQVDFSGSPVPGLEEGLLSQAAGDELLGEPGEAPGLGLHRDLALHEIERAGLGDYLPAVERSSDHFQTDPRLLGEKELLCQLDVLTTSELIVLQDIKSGPGPLGRLKDLHVVWAPLHCVHGVFSCGWYGVAETGRGGRIPAGTDARTVHSSVLQGETSESG